MYFLLFAVNVIELISNFPVTSSDNHLSEFEYSETSSKLTTFILVYFSIPVKSSAKKCKVGLCYNL